MKSRRAGLRGGLLSIYLDGFWIIAILVGADGALHACEDEQPDAADERHK